MPQGLTTAGECKAVPWHRSLETVLRRVLVLNPNTSESVTALLLRHATAMASPSASDAGPVMVHGVTARLGAPYIACESSYAVAGHAVLDAWAAVQDEGPFHAVLIGCFGDPGLHALRDSCPVPVIGLAEAAFGEAAAIGRFAVVTGGERWRPMLQRLALSLGHEQSLAGIHTVAPSGAELARDPEGARELLREACVEAARRFGVDAVILGGAGLAGQAAALRPQLPVPLVDSVEAGLSWLLAAAQTMPPVPPAGRASGLSWKGVSPEMVRLAQEAPR